MLVLVSITFVRMARLLTSEAQARTELALARDAALEASQAKSAFLATMSHEIRTPMNGVIGLNELLLTTSLDERQRQYAEGMRSAGHSLLGVINEILDFSKIEAGHLELETIDFDLVQLVEGVAELVAEPAQTKGLELLAYCSPELPAALRGDPARIRQVLLNLAGNAVKFTAAGEVVVRATLDERAGDGLVVRFEVTDTGIGMAAEDRDRLFDAVLAGRLLDHPALRRHRAGPGHLPPAGRRHGRPARRGQRARAGEHASGSRSRWSRRSTPRSRPRDPPRSWAGCASSSSTTTPRTGRSSTTSCTTGACRSTWPTAPRPPWSGCARRPRTVGATTWRPGPVHAGRGRSRAGPAGRGRACAHRDQTGADDLGAAGQPDRRTRGRRRPRR